MQDVKMSLDLPGGNRIVLLDTLGKKALDAAERARNIFLLDSSGKRLWQVSSDFDHDGGPFTSMTYEKSELRAYRWDGGMYRIDIASGKAFPCTLAK